MGIEVRILKRKEKEKLAVKPISHYSCQIRQFNLISVKPPNCNHDLFMRVKLREV